MAPFKDEQIIIIAPGSQTTLAQLGLPESFTPARLRVKSRMFPAEKEGEWEPHKIRKKDRTAPTKEEVDETNEVKKTLGESEEEEAVYEEDPFSEDGAVWPIVEGRIVNWPCFFALMDYVYKQLNPPFHTPIMLISQPVWTPKEKERLTQFFFEKFKMPAFTIVDAATAVAYAYGVHTATVIDIGLDKADISAISEFVLQETGRSVAVPGCGGQAMTQRLLELLSSKKFTREMCEQLKRNPICEVLPHGTPQPGSGEAPPDGPVNPAAAASTGAATSGPDAAIASGPRGPGPDTEVGEEQKEDEENEGVLDVANIVTSGKMSEYLAKKEKEKADRAAAKKKGTEAAANLAKQTRLPNSRREKATFMYEDHALLSALKDLNMTGQKMAEAQAALDEGARKNADGEVVATANHEATAGVEANGTSPTSAQGSIRREIEVGTERFQAASGGLLESIADAIYRTISTVEEVNKRSELWDSLIIVGNGSRLRGFKEALLQTLQTKYIISPSSATMFTSELPSNLSTPTGTGANTPQHPSLQPQGSGVNPLLLAATTAQNPHLMPHGGGTPNPMTPLHSHNTHSSHGQTPTSMKLVKTPDYFPEWKDVGMDEAGFLGAQVAAKVLFIVEGLGQGYMTRSDYNDQGPPGIREVLI